ncbi:MAG: glycosyltransferase family 4 protein [Chloroflexota bacterium]|nr:glycosyltransferase family 4 protein [Chloroflexota bacterium]MDQ5866006.1 glycosyltransferase family 4 protein [Chloroflexota bacterium]
MSRTLLYVAYPMRLDLGAANAIQTYSTVRELQRLMPGVRLVVPRWLREPSAFEELGALHLPRPAANKLSKFLPWAGWSYLERTAYAFMLVALLLVWRLTGRRYATLYVRDAVCAAWLAVLRPLHGSRVIYEVHDLEASHPSKASRWPRTFWRHFLPWLDRAALTRSDGLVSLTEAFKGWAASKGLRQPEHVTVIPDAYDPEVYFPSDAQSARAELGLPQGVPIVGYTGLTFAYRGLDLLVQAFAQVRHRHPGALLVLVGGRPHEIAELKELARRCGIPDEKVLFPGQVSQPLSARYLNASDVLVIPDTVTTMTASPLKLFEYMAVGKPIVCKDMPALREILGDDSAAFFEAGSVEALATALTSMLDDPEAARRLGATALQRSAQYTYLGRAQKIAAVVRS